jgi:hypothetical protein
MGLRMDVLVGMNTLPFFSQGESHIEASLERCSRFDRGGIQQQWELFVAVSKDVMEYLRFSFAALGEREHRIYCELQMSALREKIERNERGFEHYCSLVARHSELCSFVLTACRLRLSLDLGDHAFYDFSGMIDYVLFGDGVATFLADSTIKIRDGLNFGSRCVSGIDL